MTANEVFKMYQSWVRKNPQPMTEIESSIKFISYILAGKVSNSPVLSELVYSVSNLWVLFNDKIILNARNRTLKQPSGSSGPENDIKMLLTVIEYSEVFLEISARKLWGDRIRWVIITIVQIFKFILRLALTYKYKVNVISTPAITPLDRRKLQEEEELLKNGSGISNGFTLKSGRTIRTVSSASTSTRSWKPPDAPSTSSQQSIAELQEHTLNNKQFVAELLYIAKPLVHLGFMYAHGQKSWPPWLVSVILDVSSYGLLTTAADKAERRGNTIWSRRQLLEIQRRKLVLILYLLRSPFYDTFTKKRLTKLLLVLSDSIPLVGLILRPLADYLPHWQNTHLYLWSS